MDPRLHPPAPAGPIKSRKPAMRDGDTSRDGVGDPEAEIAGLPPLPELPQHIEKWLHSGRHWTEWTVLDALARLEANEYYLRCKHFDPPEGFDRKIRDDWEDTVNDISKIYFRSFKFAPGAEQFMALVDARGCEGRKHYCVWLRQLVGEAALRRGVRREAIHAMPFREFVESMVGPLKGEPPPHP